MGLFNDAYKYGGSHYRSFSQQPNSTDLEDLFHDDPVVQNGICAGGSLVWLKYYLTRSNDENYSNDLMKKHKNEIITIQRGLRRRDQSLSDLLILSGLQPHEVLPFNYSFNKYNLHNTAKLSTSISGVNVISYNYPGHGQHVAVYYVDDNKNMYFMDTHKGDVCIPYPNSEKWLAKYFDIYTAKCGEINITHFKPEWHAQQAKQAFRQVARDAIYYDPSLFGQTQRNRSVNDIDYDNVKISKAYKNS
jgi:hypothetical protein